MKMRSLNRLLLNVVLGGFVLLAAIAIKGAVSDEVYAVDKYVSAYFSNTENVPLNIYFVYLYGNCPNVQYDPSTIPGCYRITDPGGMNYGFLPAANGSSYNWRSAYPVLALGENPPYYVWWYATYQSGNQCVDPTDGISPTEHPDFYRVTINVECALPDVPPPGPFNMSSTPTAVCDGTSVRVTFNWTSSSNATGYDIYWRTDGGSPRSMGGPSVSNVSSGYSTAGFTPGNVLNYDVLAKNSTDTRWTTNGWYFVNLPSGCGDTPTPTNTPTPTPAPPGTLVCTPSSQNVAVGALASFTGSGGNGPSSYSWSSPGGNPLAGSGGANYGTTYNSSGTKTVNLTSGSQVKSCTVIVGSIVTPTNTPAPTATPTPPAATPTIAPPPANFNVSSDCVFGAARIRMSSYSYDFVVVYKLIDTTTGSIVGYYEAVGSDYNNFYGLASNRRYRAEFRNGGSTAPANANGPIIYQADVVTGNCAPPPTNTPTPTATPTPPPLVWDVSGAGECFNSSGGVVRFNVSAPATWYVTDTSSASNPLYTGNLGIYNNLLGGVYAFGTSGTVSLYSGTYGTGILRDLVAYTIPTAAACGVAPTATPTPIPPSWSLTGATECWPADPPSVGGVIRFNVSSSSSWYVLNSFAPDSLPYTFGGSGTQNGLLAGVYPYATSGTLSLYSGVYPAGVLRAIQAFTMPTSTDCGGPPACAFELPATPVFTGAVAGWSAGDPPPTLHQKPYVQWLGDLRGDPAGYYEFRITNDGDQNPETATPDSVDWTTEQNYWTTTTLLGNKQEFNWDTDYAKLSQHGAIGALPLQADGFPEDSILYVFVSAINTCGHADSDGAFCIKKDIFGWLQTTNGDVASGGLIDGGTAAPVGKYNSSFLQLSKSGGITNFSSRNGWSVSEDLKFSTNPPTFDGLVGLYLNKAALLPGGGGALASGVYYVNGNLTYTGNYSFNGPVAIIVRGGNLYVENNLQISGNQSGVVFMVDGDINIRDTVTEADGIYIARNTFRSAYNLSVPTFTDQLVIDGAVYSYSGFSLDRIIDPGSGSGNAVADEPGELINYEPKYLIIFDDLLAVSGTTWSEVAP